MTKLFRRNFGNTAILVFGGAGFIGSNFIRYILGRYKEIRIINFDKLTYSGNLENLKDISHDRRYKFIRGDIADKNEVFQVFRKFKPDFIINFAAETHVDRSIHLGAEEFINTNVYGVFNILEAVKKCGAEKFVSVSTDEVYGSLGLGEKKKFKETTPLAPNVPYSATKASGDFLCRAYHNTWKIPVVVTRCSNNYGPYQYPEKLIPFFILRMLENKKLPIYGDGKNVRDWIYVIDHCRALELCLLGGGPGEVYNVGGGNEKSNLDIAEIILDYFGRDKNWIEFVADRPGHDRRYAIDPAKLKRKFGWQSKYKFEKSLNGTIEWYLKNKNWMDNLKKKIKNFNPHIKI
jgi:dTDP-glucose 4,6-dehydratase